MDWYRIVFNEDGSPRSCSCFHDAGAPPEAGPLVYVTSDPVIGREALANLGALRAEIAGGMVTAVQVGTPPPPPPDPLAELREVVARNIGASPHDKRGLSDKDIGKLIIPKIKATPDMTAEDALDEIIEMILAELPGQPIIPALWVERPRKSNPAETVYMGLGPSYLYEAIKRGYCPPDTPMTWAGLVGLIVATPESQIAAWLRSL